MAGVRMSRLTSRPSMTTPRSRSIAARAARSATAGFVLQIETQFARLPGHGAIHRARVDVAIPEPRRDRTRDRALAHARRSVDRDPNPRHGHRRCLCRRCRPGCVAAGAIAAWPRASICRCRVRRPLGAPRRYRPRRSPAGIARPIRSGPAPLVDAPDRSSGRGPIGRPDRRAGDRAIRSRAGSAGGRCACGFRGRAAFRSTCGSRGRSAAAARERLEFPPAGVPGSIPASTRDRKSGPIRTRRKRSTGWPIASHMRRT